MADSVPAQFSYTVEDELGVSATVLLNALVDPAATVLDLDTHWQDVGGFLDSIIGGVIRGGHYRVMEDSVTGGKSSPAAGSRVEQSGVFNFAVSGTSYKTGITVPSIKDGVITADRINLTNADVVAFIGAGLLLVLAGLGLVHLRRTDPTAVLLPKLGARTPAPVEP